MVYMPLIYADFCIKAYPKLTETKRQFMLFVA